MNIKRKLQQLFRKMHVPSLHRSEQPEYMVPVVQSDPSIQKVNVGPVTVAVKPVPIPVLTQKFRIPYLLKVKRIVAGVLCGFNLLMLMFGYMQLNPFLVVYVLGSCFIFLDYLWKTRKPDFQREPLSI